MTDDLDAAARMRIAAELHDLYLAKAKSVGWTVRPECDVPFEALSHEGQLLDLMFADWHLAALRAQRRAVWERVIAKAEQAERDSADPLWILEWAKQQAQEGR